MILWLTCTVSWFHARATTSPFIAAPIDTLSEARDHYQKAMKFRADDELEEADDHFLLAVQFYTMLEDWNMVVRCGIYRSQLNYLLDRLDSLESVLYTSQLILDQHELTDEHFKQERVYYFRAMYFEAKAHYQAASDNLDRAVAILQAIENPGGLDSAYMSSHMALSGAIYYDRKDYETAINHYKTSLNLFPLSRPNEAKLVNIYNNLGLAYIDQGEDRDKNQVRIGMDMLDISLTLLPYLNPEVNYEEYLQTYFNLVKGFLLLGQTSQAIAYLEESRSHLEKLPHDWHIWHALQGLVSEQQGLWQQALGNYQLAIQERIEVRGPHHPSIAKLYQSMGKVALRLGRDSLALSFFQQGLRVFDPGYDPAGPFQVPVIDRVNDFYLFIQILKDKGDLLRVLHPAAFEKILPTYRQAAQAIDSLRLLYESDASKLLLSREAKAVFGSAIELLYRLYQRTHDPQLIEEAFMYSEKSKSLLLLENIRKWRNIRLRRTGKNENSSEFNELLEQEKLAKLDLILLQRTIDETREKTTPAARARVSDLEEALRNTTAHYEHIKRELSNKYPQYYEATYDQQLTTLPSVQRNLIRDRKSVLVSYFIFGSQSFAIVVGRDHFSLEPLADQEDWKNVFDDYQQSLRSLGEDLMQEEAYGKYVHSAHQLYRLLIEPVTAGFAHLPKNIYLIPDDILGFLAFEPLLVSSPTSRKPSYTLSNMDYLLEHSSLAYGYSATLLMESLVRRPADHPKAAYAGFAPVFKSGVAGKAISRDCTTGSLMYLPYSEESVEESGQLLKGDVYTHENASLANFREKANNYRIIQLATHACIDEQDALFNVIYFHDTTLATYEIFDIPLQADLIILSACETGNGDLLEGEGIMSLSRGFYYAGSSNIVTSLWPADDHATKDLMVKLNSYLHKGWKKDEALRQAKLDYLERPGMSPAGYTPTLWANFILIGNQEKIGLGGGFWKTWGWVLLLLVLVSAILSKRSKMPFFRGK